MSLRSRTISSVSWSVVAKLVSQSATFIGTIVLARLLVPEDFGLVALSVVYIGFLQIFIDAGFLHALIQRPELSQHELSSCFWLLLVVGAVAFGGTFIATDVLDRLWGVPGIGFVMAMQSSIFLVLPFRTIGQALLSREVRIDELSKLELVMNIGRLPFSLWMAWSGAGVWSLVVPQILGEIVFSISCYYRTGWKLIPVFCFKDMKPLLSYGIDISLSRVVWFAASRADQFIIGKMLGTGALGIYSLALQFSSAIPQFAAGTISRVIFPLFSKLQDNRLHLRNAYLGSTKYLTMFFLPALLGVSLVAQDLVSLLFSPQWQQAILPLQLLCILSFFRLIEAISGFLLNAVGKTRLNLIINFLTLVSTTIGVTIGSYYGGLDGVALGVLLSFVPIVTITTCYAMREIDGSFGMYVNAVLLPLKGASVMFGLCMILSKMFIGGSLARIFTMSLAGMAIYFATLLLFHPRILQDLKNEFSANRPS
jgi:teichuronic acid exporter